MDAMFSNCKSLIALNLSSFYISNDLVMNYMFHICIKLKYIDLSNFPPITLTKLPYTFRLLSSLVYLNIPSIEINSSSNMDKKTFENISSFSKICAKQPNMKQKISNLNITNNCSDICFNKNIKIGNDSNECITSCKEHGYDFEYLNICFHQCPEYTHAIINNNSNNSLICLDKNPEGYYLDIDGFYKECFESCKVCYGPGNEIDNNCSKCKTDYFFNDSFHKNNCNQKCPYYYYNKENKYICVDNCSGIYDKLIINSNKCVDDCENDTIYKYEYNKICYGECQNIIINEKEGEICFNTTIFQFINTSNSAILGENEDIYQRIKNNVLFNYDIFKEEDMVIQGKDNFYFHLTNTKKDLELLKGNNNKTNKFSVIDLGECDDILKEHYHINKSESLLILKMEKITNISSERAFQYEIYEPYNKTKLNLTICSNTTIETYTPILLSEKLQKLYVELKDLGYDLFDINSPFYQDTMNIVLIL